MAPKPLPTVFAFLAAALALTAPAARAQDVPRRPACGTARQFETPVRGAVSASARVAAASEGTALSGRIYLTPHFALHYTMGRNTHRPAWKSGDAGDLQLKAQVDTLYQRYQAANPTRRDSLMNAALDSLGAPPPAFIVRAAYYLENAYAYDKDSLGMRVPDSNLTAFYKGSVRGRFNVEIGDIDALQPGYDGTYGLTFKPVVTDTPGAYFSTSLLIENDFLYGASVNSSTGSVTGTPIRVFTTDSTGQTHLLHDYGYDWDLGLAVTIAHEFYHAVQFQYTPTVDSYHAWYELSAVGMEERLAPTVNDYLGYLPAVLRSGSPVYLLTGPGDNVNYGNGIFHTFLAQKLGKTFDAAIWQRLTENANNLPEALVRSAGSAARWDSLYAAYAASLAIAGRPGAAASPLAFSPDFAIWPRPRLDTVGAAGTSYSLSRLTYRLLAPVPSAVTWASYTGLTGAWRVSQAGTAYSTQFLSDSLVPLQSNGAIALAVANSSFNVARPVLLKRGGSPDAVSAFPNPATRAAGSIHFNASTGGSAAVLTVVSESGRRVAALTPDPTGSFWTWNFRDGRDQALPAGVYYFGVTGGTPQTLLVLP